MRTWKQGVVGKITIGNGVTIFTKCTKYPLLRVYKSFDISSNMLVDEICAIFIDLDVLKKIEKIGFIMLENEERKLLKQFSIETINGSSRVDKLKIEAPLLFTQIEEAAKLGIINLDMFDEIITKNWQ